MYQLFECSGQMLHVTSAYGLLARTSHIAPPNLKKTRKYSPTIWPEGEEEKYLANSTDRSAFPKILITLFPTKYTYLLSSESSLKVQLNSIKLEELGFPGDTHNSLCIRIGCASSWCGNLWMKILFAHTHRHTVYKGITTVNTPVWIMRGTAFPNP